MARATSPMNQSLVASEASDIRAPSNWLLMIRYDWIGLGVTVFVGLPLVAKPGVTTSISVAVTTRRAVYSFERLTTRSLGWIMIGSPVHGSLIAASTCSAASTLVQSESALPLAITLIQGLADWYVAYVVPFQL